jgi:molybdate/tungstate transport system permease protein
MRKMLHSNLMSIIFGLLGSIILLFIATPIFKMVLLSGPESLAGAFSDETVIKSILLSLSSALAATLLGFLFGVPLAYLLARHEFPGKRIIEGLIDLPIVIPHSAAGIALLFVFGRNFLLGRLFGLVGISFIDSTAGIIIAMLFVSVPFLIDSASEGFRRVDPRMERVARTLGASPWQIFYRITIPLSWRSILGGGIMMWARGISEFGAVIMLTYHPMTAPIVIYERFETYGLNYALPVATLLVVICGILFLAFRLLNRTGGNRD